MKKTAFQVRFKSAFAITDLVGLKGKIDGLNITKAATDIYAIQQNNGPLSINREMFKKVFSQDYNPKMLDILRVQGIYKNDQKNILLKTYGW